MCGINFIYNPSLSSTKLTAQICLMNSLVKHRGPDDSQYLVNKPYALGFNRLTIVGGLEGQQPIYNIDNTCILICNGEIFNYLELKNKFFPTEKFNTTSDVEIILHLYNKFGTDLVNYLEGQFAFVLVDNVREVVFFARDKYGINPIFFYSDKETFAISSEIKALTFSNICKSTKLDTEAIADTLFFYGTRKFSTCFKNIKQIPAGHYGVYDLGSKTINTKRYWKFSKKNNHKTQLSNIKKILKESIEKRLQGDSPVGVYLSGGLDSSIVSAVCNKIQKPVAFSISFKNKKYDEAPFQRRVSKYLSLENVTVHIENKDILNNLVKTIYHCETPLTRTAPIPLYLLSQAVKKRNIKFVLCGEGADELFMGYPVFRKSLSSIEDKYQANNKLSPFFKDKRIRNKIKKTFLSLIGQKGRKDINLRQIEIETKLSNYLLSNQGDRMSMSHGVEQRFPFLDSHVTNFAEALTEKDLIENGQGKILLRNEFKDILPSAILSREKQGYLSPDLDVVKEIIKERQFDDLLSKNVIEGANIFYSSKVEKLIKKIEEGDSELTENHAKVFLLILSTQILYKLFIEKDKDFLQKYG